MANKSNLSSILASVALSGLTLSVFAFARDRGPESTVRKFHQAIMVQDQVRLERLMVDMKTIGGQGLLSEVGAFLQRSSDVQFGRVQTVGRQSTVDVIYRLPNSNTLAAIRFVVQKDDLTWRINATQTIDLQNAMYDFS